MYWDRLRFYLFFSNQFMGIFQNSMIFSWKIGFFFFMKNMFKYVPINLGKAEKRIFGSLIVPSFRVLLSLSHNDHPKYMF